MVGVTITTHAALVQAEETERPVHVAVTLNRAPGAERCISSEEIVKRTRARTGSDTLLTVDRRDAHFLLIGLIEPHAEGFRTQLVLRDVSGRALGQRTFDSPARSCRSLDESLILSLLLLVDAPRVRAAAPHDTMGELAELVP